MVRHMRGLTAATAVERTGAIGRPGRPARWMVLGLLVLWGSLEWGRGAAAALPIEYFALGDSIASGHGLGDDGTVCRRSLEAYPGRVIQHLQMTFAVQRFELLACSGATTATLGDQVTQALSQLSASPTLITLTAGANDFGWSDIFPFSQRLCTQSDEAFSAWAEGVARAVEDRLVVQLERLLSYPQVEVIVTDYYNPTNTSGAFWRAVNPRCLLVDVYDRSEQGVHALNAAIARAWQRLGSPSAVRIATVRDAFRGHEAPRPWCGSAPPEVAGAWIQYPTDPDSNATPVGGDCFHPNRAGAQQFAAAVTELIPPDLAQPLRLRVNDHSLQAGDVLTLTLTVAPEPSPMVIDLYVALQLPDQSLWFLHGDGRFTPEIQPLLAGWTVAPWRAELFRYAFTGAEPAGSYRWLAVFTEPGTGLIVGAIAEAPFTFSP